MEALASTEKLLQDKVNKTAKVVILTPRKVIKLEVTLQPPLRIKWKRLAFTAVLNTFLSECSFSLYFSPLLVPVIFKLLFVFPPLICEHAGFFGFA